MLLLAPTSGNLALALAIAAWLDTKAKRSGSAKTACAYATTLASFRAACQGVGLDLDAGDIRTLALVAQGWAGRTKMDGRPVTPATFNQRLAIVSSFYTFSRRRGLLTSENPAALVDRRPVQSYAAAVPLDASTVAERLSVIDRATLAGLRDYALLAIALQTGRRLSELAGLRWEHVRLDGGRVTLDWPHTKGGKMLHDALPAVVGEALLAWLEAAYGAQLGPTLAAESPVWRSLSRNASCGRALGIQSIADICERRLGTSKVHATRHTFAHAMEQVGAKVSDIQARLGHASLQTTGRYLAALRAAENAHAFDLAALFGLAPAPGRSPSSSRSADSSGRERA
jgi:integrase